MPGNRGVYLLSRRLDGYHELVMLTLWSSWSSIREFAGDPPEQANYDVYHRRGYDYLVELPEKVEHLEILEAENLEVG